MLAKAETIIFATSSNDRVTARTMCHVNDGTDIYFGTSRTSLKYAQLTANPNVALATGSLQIEATAVDCGHPDENPDYKRIYVAKFPHLGGLYESTPDDVVIKCVPKKIVVYRYINGPVWDTLDVENQKAYRTA
jgi:uncharacterized pyridoxamine 5'-phosphate oxidase family protein